MARAKFVVVNTSASAVTHHCYLKVLGAVLMIMLLFSGIAVSAEENCTTEDAGKCDVVHRKNNGSHSNTDITSTLAPNPPKIAPQSMDMLSEDQMDEIAQTVQIHNASTTEEPTGRALNFTTDAHVNGNVLQTNGSKARNLNDLSDVTIDENDDSDESEMQSAKILTPKDASLDSRTSVCEKGGLTYEEGEKLEVGCDSVCTCRKGKMECADRCPLPFFRKGKKIDDPLCAAKEADDPCCSIMVCAADTETEPLEMCSYKNKTYNRGKIFDKGCEEVCSCEIAGNISCKPRCLPVNKTSDRCVEVQDPKDPCCKTILCDVTLDDQNDHDENKDTNKDETRKSKLLAAKFVNSSTVELTFDVIPEDDFIFVEASEDKNRWETYKIDADKYVTIKPSSKYLRMENSDEVIKIEGNSTSQSEVAIDGTCSYKGSSFKIGDEFNDNCTSLCVCKESGMRCLNLDCPTYFGVDVLDPNCVEWETVPPHFVPSPPNCCPQEIVCKNNGSCVHEGQMYQNWQQLPPNITGCDKRCYCEMGKVECQNSCPPVTALPPPDLECLPHQAKIGYLPDDDCCKYWVCNEDRNQQETRRNETTKDKQSPKTDKTLTTITTTSVPNLGPFILHPTKEPSKILGPLLAYGNKDDMGPTELPTKPTQPPKNTLVSPYENPFFHEQRPQKLPHNNTTLKKNKPVTPHSRVPTNYDKKEQKNPKPKPNDGFVFVTPPPNKQISDNFVPGKQKNHFDVSQSLPNKPQQQADDLLQFINQHPEIVNYPPGSVLEIHSVPNNQKPNGPPFVLPNDRPGQHQLVPYVISHNSQNPVEDLPPGITLEQILQEIHRTTNPHNVVPFPQNGPVLLAPQSGHVLTNHPNISYSGGPMFPGNYPNHPGFQPPQDEISVHTLEAVDAHTVRLAFMVPPVIVGLHGRVEVRYTHDDDDNFNNWELQVFAPPNDLIATPQLEFDLLDLKADTEYRIKITITLRDLHNTPSSRVYKIKTPRDPNATTLPPMIPIKPELVIADINATWVTVTWRKFTEYELQFIDGVQLRYKELEGKIYDATPLIHRSVTSYTLENLKPNTKYEIGIFFIPFPGQMTELHSTHMLHFTTANEMNTYGFNVTLDVGHVKSTSVEITWSGVPYPEDKYVNIYRAIYQSDTGKEDQSTFKIAKRDSPTKTIIMDLKPGTRYRLWLEVYLTNGKIKTSNVQDFITKPRPAVALGATSQQASETREAPKSDYYGPLVIVAILAAIAILSTLILLLILLRRHNQNKAAITPPSRISQSAYDNPTYKVEIQQETMGN